MSEQPGEARIEAVAERLYASLPSHMRSADAENGWSLKAFIELLAGESARIDSEIDALYDSMFVETAPDEALLEIAALVGSEPLQPLPEGSGYDSRAFVANTVRYRRGKGTARVLEGLANDVGGFGATAVEYFQRIVRLQHLIDVRPERPGTGRIVPGRTAAQIGTAFDMLPRLADLRSIARAAGRHHVPHVGVHILRPICPEFAAPTDVDDAAMAAVPAMAPWPDGATQHPGYFQLSAQPGRALRLFNPDRRSQVDQDRSSESDLPDRLSRLALHLETQELRHAALEGRDAIVGDKPWFDEAGRPFTIFVHEQGATDFTRVPPEQVLIANLEAFPVPAAARPANDRNHAWFEPGPTAPVARTGTSPIRCAFDPVTGRLITAPPRAGVAEVDQVRIAYATGIGRKIGAGPQERNADDLPFDILDTDKVSHFVRIVDATAALTGTPSSNRRTVDSLAEALDDWDLHGAGMRGIIALIRCDREAAAGGFGVTVHPGSELHVVAARWSEPRVAPGLPSNPQRHGFLVRQDRRFTIESPVKVSAPAGSGTAPRGVLVLDGLEMAAGLTLLKNAVATLRVRHCTLRNPAGGAAAALTTSAALVGAEVTIEDSIVGRVRLDFGTDAASGALSISGSVVSPDGATGEAITARSLDSRIDDTTLLGRSSFKSLEATNTIFADRVEVVRRQAGCVRYCWLAQGSVVPRRFQCQPDRALAAAEERKGSALTAGEGRAVSLRVQPLFLDTSLDEPTLAMLHPMTTDDVRLGGEESAEIGAFSVAAEGLRMANVASLFDDYLPFGLEAALIDDTRSTAVAARRNVP